MPSCVNNIKFRNCILRIGVDDMSIEYCVGLVSIVLFIVTLFVLVMSESEQGFIDQCLYCAGLITILGLVFFLLGWMMV